MFFSIHKMRFYSMVVEKKKYTYRDRAEHQKYTKIAKWTGIEFQEHIMLQLILS